MVAIELLKGGVQSLEPYLQPSGELIDPVFGEPTQYGTPYYALCNAALAAQEGDERAHYADKAARGLNASLHHLTDLTLQPTLSSFRRDTGATGRGSHRDFFWPAVLKTYRILRDLGVGKADTSVERISALDIEVAFHTRPPSNWAAVWLSGEWLRMAEGLSPYTLDQFDSWLGAFFGGAVLLEQGFFQEPGHSNSYDLFTRLHLADILQAGYRGAWYEALATLMATGLERSLAVQLSDGSLASAHRSTGQTWTLGAQCAYFTHAANFFRDQDHERSRGATGAAHLALVSLARWQRPAGPFSPVENLLPSSYRVGYETYTADGHYSSLALSFLASAIYNGLGQSEAVDARRPRRVQIERDPTHRAILHHGPYSVHVNACPASGYDAFGITDLSFGPQRYLHFVSSVKHIESGRLYNLGLACRVQPGWSELTVMAQEDFALLAIERGDKPVSMQLEARAKGRLHKYKLDVRIETDGVHITESTPGKSDYKTLLIPYLRDPGTGVTTEVHVDGNAAWFRLGSEKLRFTFAAPVETVLILPYGYENRRGLCGLLRVDFMDVRESVTYHVSRRS